jgi:hypothetical protein
VYRRIFMAIRVGAALLVAALLALAASYYATPLRERAHHPGYWDWKPGGRFGHLLGITGSSMMVLMLGYSARKRLRALRRAGPLSRWLDAHIFLGLLGPALVVLHSSFKVKGLVALSFWSMIAVALSGVLGRYLYLQIPRTRAGEEVGLRDVEAEDRALSERLKGRFGWSDALLADLEALSRPADTRRGLLAGLFGLYAGDLRLRFRLRAFLKRCPPVTPRLLADFEHLVRHKAQLRRRLALWDRVHELFHYWHVAHKPFAVVMYLFMVVHVAVALMTGYGWVGFSS